MIIIISIVGILNENVRNYCLIKFFLYLIVYKMIKICSYEDYRFLGTYKELNTFR